MKYLFYPIAILLLALTCAEFFPVLMYACKHIAVYQWLLYGIGAYFIIRRFNFFSRNEQWLQTTSHEVTHAIVGMMFFHKIHSLQANEDHGVVYHSGRKIGDIFISLAPYCLPILTYAFLLLRIMGANRMLYVLFRSPRRAPGEKHSPQNSAKLKKRFRNGSKRPVPRSICGVIPPSWPSELFMMWPTSLPGPSALITKECTNTASELSLKLNLTTGFSGI